MALLNYGVGPIVKGFHDISIIRIIARHNRESLHKLFCFTKSSESWKWGGRARVGARSSVAGATTRGAATAIVELSRVVLSSRRSAAAFGRDARIHSRGSILATLADGSPAVDARWAQGRLSPPGAMPTPSVRSRCCRAGGAPQRQRSANAAGAPSIPEFTENHGVNLEIMDKPKSGQIMALDGQK